MVSNFANAFKAMTPLPKLNQTFSAMPSSRSSKTDLANEQMQTEQSSHRNKMVVEYQSRERVQRLRQDLPETPNSKYKYK